MVAAYVKKFARLALIAPSNDIHILVSFIGNLIIRHQGLKKMLTTKPTDPEIGKQFHFNPYATREINLVRQISQISIISKIKKKLKTFFTKNNREFSIKNI